MADPLNKYKGQAITRKGGGIVAARFIDSTTFLPISGAKWVIFGYLKSTSVNLEDENAVDEKDERDLLVASIDGTGKCEIDTVLMQRDRDSIFLGENYRGKLVQIYYYGGVTDGKNVEWVLPVAKLIPKIKVDYDATKTTNIPISIKALAQVQTSVVYPPLPDSSGTSNIANGVQWTAFANQNGYSGHTAIEGSTPPYYGSTGDSFNASTRTWDSFGQLFQVFETPVAS